MSLIPYRGRDPWRALATFRDEIDKMFDNWFGKIPALKQEMFSPSVDIWEDDENIYVEADLPGMEQKDISLKIKDGSLVISAKKTEIKEEKKKNYYRSERYQGSFYRSIELPSAVDESKIKASYKSGVLKVTLPKKEEDKGKEIQIDVE